MLGRCSHTPSAIGYLTQTLQPTVALREEARQAAETALTLQPNLGEAVLAKGYYHYACLKDYDTAVRYFEQARPLLPNSSRIPESLAYVARRRGQWDRSEAYFNEAERLDPRNVYLLTQHALSYIAFVVFPKRCENLIRFSISHRTTSIPSRLRRYRTSRGRPAAGRCTARSAPSERRRQFARWKHKFTKRSWNVALHQSSLG